MLQTVPRISSEFKGKRGRSDHQCALFRTVLSHRFLGIVLLQTSLLFQSSDKMIQLLMKQEEVNCRSFCKDINHKKQDNVVRHSIVRDYFEVHSHPQKLCGHQIEHDCYHCRTF